MAVKVDVISDFVCPWCWIGKRNLDTLAADVGVERRWHPYLLHPDMPKGGMARDELVRQKFGSEERARDLAAGVVAAAKSVGLDIDYSKIKVTPDTRDAHRLVRWAGGQGRADAVAEALFQAYFSEGRDIGDPGVLADIGEAAGMDRALILELLSGDADAEAVDMEANRARAIGVTGVPTYVFGDSVAVVGAQPPEYLRRAVNAAERNNAAAQADSAA